VQHRVDRYLAREIVPPFGVALLAFLVFIGLELVISLSDAVFARGAGAAEMLRLLLYKLPSLLTFAIPAGALLATFLAFGRLAADRELLAFQALGYSLRRLTVPFLLFGVAASALSFSLGEFGAPPAEAAYRRELMAILYRGSVPSIQEDVFFRGAEGELYYVERYDGQRVMGVVVYDLRGRLYPQDGPFPNVITAREGWFRGGTLELHGGRVLRFASDGGLEELVRFERLSLEVGEDVQRAVLGGKTPSEMSLRELAERIDLLRRSGLDPRALVVEYHGKLAISVAAFVFVLFGAPLGALLGRRGRATGAIAGFLLAAAAQALFVWARTMARRGVLPAFLGGWLPHIAFGLLGLVLFLAVDRLRLRGTLAFLLLAMIGVGAGAAPPFAELWADELVLDSAGTVLTGTRVRAHFQGYTLVAAHLVAREEEGWTVEATQASLTGSDGELQAEHLTVRFTPDGEPAGAVAAGFAGRSTFRGPEKEETLLFSGAWGEAELADGELVRLEARSVRFTTCPCFPHAPYLVRADRFVLRPAKWLFAEGVTVESFGVAVGWLPFYAARLGEEASPLFPEVGRAGADWLLRWSFPWAFGEGVAGAADLTWYVGTGRVDPAIQAVWDTGGIWASPTGLRLRAEGRWEGEPWRAALRVTEDQLSADLSGDLAGWAWSLSWGRVEAGDQTYERMPEFSLTRPKVEWLDGTLAVTLSGGRFREGQTESLRAGVDLSWSRRWVVGPAVVDVPWRLGVDQYREAGRAFFSLSPRLTVGGLSFGYQGRWEVGRSPFDFDATPPLSRLALELATRAGGWRERLSLGWDLAAEAALPARWNLSRPGLSWEVTFLPAPFALHGSTWSLSWQDEGVAVIVVGGFRASPWRWEDTLVKGHWSGEAFSLSGGARVAASPARVTRVALAGEWRPVPEWGLGLALEYDGPTARLVQLEGSVVRVFAGCLRVGVVATLTGIRFTVEVPAFPQAKIRFAPLDEGLQIGE
jgi:LPS export ABC transporter permease LptG